MYLLLYAKLYVLKLYLKKSFTGIVNGSCNFENTICGWSVSSNGTYQWIRGRGKSPETSTGPDRDTTSSGKIAIQT